MHFAIDVDENNWKRNEVGDENLIYSSQDNIAFPGRRHGET
jgi:hypothetical protein